MTKLGGQSIKVEYGKISITWDEDFLVTGFSRANRKHYVTSIFKLLGELTCLTLCFIVSLAPM